MNVAAQHPEPPRQPAPSLETLSPPTGKAKERTDMLDAEPSARLAAAAAGMMWAWPLAAARVADAWVSRSWSVWSQLLRPAALPVRPWWPLVSAPVPALWLATVTSPQNGPAAVEPPAPAAAEPGFASYRSPGGHAAAQVLGPDLATTGRLSCAPSA
jgi:hypothetical protein